MIIFHVECLSQIEHQIFVIMYNCLFRCQATDNLAQQVLSSLPPALRTALDEWSSTSISTFPPACGWKNQFDKDPLPRESYIVATILAHTQLLNTGINIRQYNIAQRCFSLVISLYLIFIRCLRLFLSVSILSQSLFFLHCVSLFTVFFLLSECPSFLHLISCALY